MRSTAFKYGSLVIGLMAAVVIILSQSLSFKEVSAKGKHKTECSAGDAKKGSTGEEGDRVIASISTTGFPSSAQVSFFQDAFCLFEIRYSDKSSSEGSDPVSVPINKFFSTILEVIISPNAP